ncbi:hypothetical protein ACM61V_19580 [Sphingomonas sp. TX0543]|uniref:hypothetical protein n=1 Tax=Sphingomonas sp. TX0543 TaxID=3399682 RepID=UPI003AFA7E13
MYRVHYFDTSEAAHDACLDDGPCIEEGDVLAILSEGVIGLASSTIRSPSPSTPAHCASSARWRWTCC